MNQRTTIFKIIYIIMSALFINSCNGQNKKTPATVRTAAVAGTFYPAEKDTILKMMTEYFQPYAKKVEDEHVAAVIVPHAGYVFSGAVAASAYTQINPDFTYEHVFLIGPSHHVYLDGASINEQFDYYETPLGKIKVDTKLCKMLIAEHKDCFTCNPAAHDKEHCLEVQLPFLQYYLKQLPPIVPIITGTQSLHSIQQIAEALKPYFNEKNLFVISSDFSHYPSYKDAEKADGRTGAALESGSLKNFIEAIDANAKENIPNLATSACGQSAIAVLLCMTEGDKNIEIRHTLYKNSGDSKYADHSQVVGYHAFTFIRKTDGAQNENAFSLTDKEQQTLLQIARRTIQNRLNNTQDSVCKNSDLTATLRSKCGAFVTLNEGGRLRGCIGHFGNNEPLHHVVENMAEAAAFEDPRFNPLQSSELDKIEIEISVLSPMKKINSIDEFILGKHGIYISKNGRSGTFLPQVADETNWTKEEFLSHCAHDKAGLEWDGWKDANLYTYEAFVFKEKK